MGATQSAPGNIRPRQIELYTNYTYTNPSAVAGAASIYDYRYKNVQATPGESEASRAERQRKLQQTKLDDQYCTLEASVSPINPVNPDLTNEENMRMAKSLGGINAVKSFYNNLHLKANESGMKNTDRAQYIKKCYGKQLSVQADADPAIIKGLPVATTECGAKARYIRIWGNGTEIQNFAQVIVTDARGENVAREKPTTSFSTFQQQVGDGRFSHKFAVDGTYSSKRGASIYVANGSSSNEFWEVDLQGTYDIVQIVFYNRGETSQSNAIGMKLVLYPDGTTPQQRTRDYSSTPYSTTAFTSGEVQFFSLAQTGASSRGCPAFSTSQRGNILTENTKTKSGETTFKTTLDTSSKPVFIVAFNGQKDTTRFNGAEYIWNEPYGAIKSKDYGSTGCTFWTSIENTTRTPKQYTFYFRVNGDVGFISLNRVNLTIPSDANNSHNSATIPNVSLMLIPGINIIQINIKKRTDVDSNCWIGSILTPDKQYINQTTVDNWKSSTAPQLGTFTDSAASSSFNPTELSRKIFTDDANMGAAKWLWNQALAAISFADTNIVHFYANLNVSGTDVKTYTFRSQVDDKLKLTVNGMIYQEMTNTEWSRTENSKPIAKDIQIKVVPGANLIQVDCENTTGAAGFRAVIKDETDKIVLTTNATDWRMTTAPLKTFATDPCGYVADSLTDIPVECGQVLLNNGVGATKSTNLASDDQWNAIKSQSRSQLNTLFTTDTNERCQYYKDTVTGLPLVCREALINAKLGTKAATISGDTLSGSTRNQINTMLDTDDVNRCAYYNNTSTGLPWKCYNEVFNEVCGRDISETDYRTISGTGSLLGTDYTKTTFREYINRDWASRQSSGEELPQIKCKGSKTCPDGYKYNTTSQKCEKVTPVSNYRRTVIDRPLRPCTDWHMSHGHCWITPSEQPNKTCYYNINDRCHGTCAWCVGGRSVTWTTQVADRLLPCPAGYSVYETTSCISDVPNNVEASGVMDGYGYQYKCATGETRRSSDRACVSSKDPNF